MDKFALTNAIYNMDAAYQKFFKEHAGYPKFKSKHDNHKSYTTNFTNGNITVDFGCNRVKLPKLKNVKAKLHRNFSGQIKSATILQNSEWKILCINFSGNRTRGTATYKSKYRNRFRY